MAVLISDEHPSSGVDLQEIEAWAQAALIAEGYPVTAEVALTLIEDDDMASWNASALGREGATDVLSFPVEALTPGLPPPPDPAGPPLLLGDVMIAPDYVRRQAEALGLSIQDEMALIVTHGVLHLLGYDHQDDAEAEVMEARESHILAIQGMVRR
jgi:probable rRNA maturation factor